MNDEENSAAAPAPVTGKGVPEMSIPELVGSIYDSAPAAERCRMLEALMRPLGALALVGLCNGVFARIWFRSGWHNLRIQPEDALSVQSVDVISLVDYVQQASRETIGGLASALASSPAMAYSAATAMLVAVLVRRIQSSNAARDGGTRPRAAD